MSDSPRWCAACKTWGDHHTDRCSLSPGVVAVTGLRVAALAHAIECYDGPDDDTIPVLRHWLRDLREALRGDA